MNSTLKSIIDELSKLSNKRSFERLAFDMNIDGQVAGSFSAIDDENQPVHINDYMFDAPSIFFMCKSISIFSKVVIFNCVYPAKRYVNDAMFAEDAYDELCTIPVPEEYEKVIIRIDGKEYELAGFEDSGTFGIEHDEVDGNKFAFIGPIMTKPMIELDYTRWANEKAKEAWSIEQKTLSDIAVSPYLAEEDDIDECDGGGAAAGGGGDAGGAGGGDAGGGATSVSSGDASGISTSDVLGDYEPGKGFMGDNFYLPFHVRCPLHRYGGEIAFGGSKRKKGENGKPKKTPYEKGMKTVIQMFEDDDVAGSQKVDKAKLRRKMRTIASGIKNMSDVSAVEAKLRNSKNQIESRLSNSRFEEAKQIAIEFGMFLKDVCTGKYNASWFTISMVAAAIVYLLLPADVIPDVIPIIGQIDDAMVLWMVYKAIKDEFDEWRKSKNMALNEFVEMNEAMRSLTPVDMVMTLGLDDLKGVDDYDIVHDTFTEFMDTLDPKKDKKLIAQWERMKKNNDTRDVYQELWSRWYAANHLPEPNTKEHGDVQYADRESAPDKWAPYLKNLDNHYLYCLYDDGTLEIIGSAKTNPRVIKHYINLYGISKLNKQYEKLIAAIKKSKPGFEPVKMTTKSNYSNTGDIAYGVIKKNDGWHVTLTDAKDREYALVTVDKAFKTKEAAESLPTQDNELVGSRNIIKKKNGWYVTYRDQRKTEPKVVVTNTTYKTKEDAQNAMIQLRITNGDATGTAKVIKKKSGWYVAFTDADTGKTTTLDTRYNTKEDAEVAKHALRYVDADDDDEDTSTNDIFTYEKDKDGSWYIVQHFDMNNSVRIGPFDSKKDASDAMKQENIPEFKTVKIVNIRGDYYIRSIDERIKMQIGPFQGTLGQKLATRYALQHDMELEKGNSNGSIAKFKRMQRPFFLFQYKMDGVDCADLTFADNEERAMKRFQSQYREFVGIQNSIDPVYDIQFLEDSLKPAKITDIEITRIPQNAPNALDEAFKIFKLLGNPFTHRELQHLKKNPNVQYKLLKGNTSYSTANDFHSKFISTVRKAEDPVSKDSAELQKKVEQALIDRQNMKKLGRKRRS